MTSKPQALFNDAQTRAQRFETKRDKLTQKLARAQRKYEAAQELADYLATIVKP